MKDKTNKWFQSEPISTKRRLIKFKKTKITDEFWCIDSNNLDIENNKVYNTTDAFIKRDLKPHFLNVVNHFPKEEQNNFYEFLDRTYLKIKRKKKIKKIKLLQVNKYK